MKVKVYRKSNHKLPSYATEMSAGLDLVASLEKSVHVNPHERCIIPTGLYIELPQNYEARIQPRSGLALKNGISVLNSPGCIDADYRGEIKVIIINHGNEPYTINDGDRIAQMIVSPVVQVEWDEVHTPEDLETTLRGSGGFGHSGK